MQQRIMAHIAVVRTSYIDICLQHFCIMYFNSVHIQEERERGRRGGGGGGGGGGVHYNLYILKLKLIVKQLFCMQVLHIYILILSIQCNSLSF